MSYWKPLFFVGFSQPQVLSSIASTLRSNQAPSSGLRNESPSHLKTPGRELENISEFSSLLFSPDVELRAYSIYLVCIGFSIPTQFILAGWMRSTPAILPRTLGQSRKGALAHLGWGGRGWCGRGSAGHSGSSDKTQKRWPGHRVVGARFKKKVSQLEPVHFISGICFCWSLCDATGILKKCDPAPHGFEISWSFRGTGRSSH